MISKIKLVNLNIKMDLEKSINKTNQKSKLIIIKMYFQPQAANKGMKIKGSSIDVFSNS